MNAITLTMDQATAIHNALEMGHAAVAAEAAQFHAAMRGYKEEQHKQMDADVAQMWAAVQMLRLVAGKAAIQQPMKDSPPGQADEPKCPDTP